MAARIVALFNLKLGVSAAQYEDWARRVDLPTVNALGSIDGFEVLRATGLLMSEAAPPFAYIEIIDVNDMDKFGADVSTDHMKGVAAEFQAMVQDLVFITTDKL
jgi:REDY-like protein HapK